MRSSTIEKTDQGIKVMVMENKKMDMETRRRGQNAGEKDLKETGLEGVIIVDKLVIERSSARSSLGMALWHKVNNKVTKANQYRIW